MNPKGVGVQTERSGVEVPVRWEMLREGKIARAPVLDYSEPNEEKLVVV